MEISISNKCRMISPSPTLAIDAKFKSMKAEGVDVVGFGKSDLPKEPLTIYDYENLVLELIDSADAKIRKYAYVICGNLPTEKLYNRLKEQIYKEFKKSKDDRIFWIRTGKKWT